ncbi:hypothetical protein CDD83_5089 [Cordyceps sp. RAO-2017]|nr:hypothetical protein CDD83_5089 [Cordyceps sp. RAO-2017]
MAGKTPPGGDASLEVMRQLDELAREGGHPTIDDLFRATLADHKLAAEDRDLSEELIKKDLGPKPNWNSFWYDEEDPEMITEEHDKFDEDDITSMAHGKLDEVREMRHYARLAVWEMPLLSKFAKPFVPPTDDQVLRWRFTTYMGDSHPSENKVVVQFAPDDLKLTPVQTEKLKKLAGPRYNPETEFVRMSCESFEHQAQNQQHLLDLVRGLIAAAKDPADTFEDVPLDLRHHPVKPKPRFPPEWRMTPERHQQLQEQRQAAQLADRQRSDEGLLVDGAKMVQDYQTARAAEEESRQRELEAKAVEAAKSPPKSDKSDKRLKRKK